MRRQLVLSLRRQTRGAARPFAGKTFEESKTEAIAAATSSFGVSRTVVADRSFGYTLLRVAVESVLLLSRRAREVRF